MKDKLDRTIKEKLPQDAYLAHWQDGTSTYFSPSNRSIYLLKDDSGESFIQLKGQALWRLLEIFEAVGAYQLPSGIKPKTILFIEDDNALHGLLAQAVKKKFWNRVKIIGFLEGLPAYEFYKRHADDIDLIISCMLLPDTDGIKLLRMCKELTPRKPYIVHTAYSYRDDFVAWASDAYITKGADLSELIETIRQLMDL